MEQWMPYAYTAIVSIAFTAMGFYIWNYKSAKKEAAEKPQPKPSNPLQLQAYERLTLFAERCKLENLITRLYQNGMSGRDMQQTLQAAIKQEFDHNITQQIYVAPEIWQAITKLKDQNTYIINQLASTMPANATAMDLNKLILNFSASNPESTMNHLVLDAIAYEAKKLM